MENTVLCYIENNKNEYLMLHRTKKHSDLNEGKWLGIGGHIENNETIYEAVKREVIEETGLSLDNYVLRGKVLFVNDDYSELMYLFTAKTTMCSIIECDEGDLAWISKNDIYKLNLWEGDRVFLDKLINSDEYFEIKLIYSNDVFVRSENI